jgi:predicted Zn-dependent protease
MRALVLAAVVACAPPVAYRADARFTPSQREEIRQAAATWNGLVEPGKRITEGDAWTVLAEEPPVGGANGLCRRSTRTIWIRNPPIEATVYAVALHELGHALGLGHVSRGVMDPTRVTVEFSDEDRAECRKAGACK